MNYGNPTPEQVVETIKQLGASADGAPPAAAQLLENWRVAVQARAENPDARLADNCNEPSA